jgi:hypothetical protein
MPLQNYDLSDPVLIASNRRGEVAPLQLAAFRGETHTGEIPQDVAVRHVALQKRHRRLLLILLAIVLVSAGLLVIFWGIEGIRLSLGIFILLVVVVVLVVSIIQTWDAIQKRLIASELSAGRIEQAEGEITWRWGRYIARIPSRRLRPLLGELNLLPGRYRFYYLSRTKRLLSAERLDMRQAGIHELLKILAQANHFSPQALEANRERRLARTQLPWLLLSPWIPVGEFILIVAPVALLSNFFLGFVERSFEPIGKDLLPELIGTGLGLALAFGLLSPRQIKRTVADLLAGAVKCVEGEIVKEQEDTWHYYSVDPDFRFRVSRVAYNALVEGLHYRVYYAPQSKIVVAIEPMNLRG